MKKILIFMAVASLLSSTSNVYAECENGLEFNGRNEHTFCMSNSTMNWFSAFAWCLAHNYRLATIEEACAGMESFTVNGSTGAADYKCGNMYVSGVDNVWTARAWNDNHALYLTGSQNKKAMSAARTKATSYKALCIESSAQ